MTDNNIDFFVPDGRPLQDALVRTTHLAIVAHQDDLEINCFHGIAQCYQRSDLWFTGIVITNGAGSPRGGYYASVSDDEMVTIRNEEQKQAASLGQYSLVIQYGASSSQIKGRRDHSLIVDLANWMKLAKPQIIYLHNIADRHDTHVRTAIHALDALKLIPENEFPEQVLGVEGWRNLDWLPDPYRSRLDVGQHRQLHDQLIRLFKSQVAGGKRYDLASEARHRANATFDQSHTIDTTEYVSLAMDLLPLLKQQNCQYSDYLGSIVEDFLSDSTRILNS